MLQIAITTSQNVNINFRLASIGERILAFLVDLLVMGAYLLGLYWLIDRVLKIGDAINSLDYFSTAAFYIVVSFPVFAYALLTESLMEGQTFGKKLIGIKTVKIDGYQCGFPDYLIRWVFRSIEIFMFGGVPALLSVIISGKNQRLGDMAAGTAVISLKNKVKITHTILEQLQEDYVPSFPGVIALNDNDVRIIKENLVRAVRTEDHKKIHLLSNKIKTVLKLNTGDLNGMTERQFIQKIIKDYNYYTGKED